MNEKIQSLGKISRPSSDARLAHATIFLIIAAGVALIPLLPIGIVAGVASPIFGAASAVHYTLQLAAVFTTVILTWRLSATSTCARVCVSGTVILFGACIGMLDAVPITARDALIHHLAVPRWWIESGRIHQIRWHEWSYYPMLLELGFTGLMKYGGVALTPYYHASYLLLLAGTVASLLQRAGRSAAESCAGFCVMLTVPIAFRLATIPDVDLGLALFASATIVAILTWGEKHGSPLWAVLAGVSLGLALSTKYNGILAAVVIVALMVVYAKRMKLSWFKTLGGICIVCVATCAVFLPWAFKDYVWTGNPMYPLFNNIFNPSHVSDAPRGLSPLQERLMLYGESWTDIALTPLRMLFFGADNNPRMFDGALTPLLLFGVVPIFKPRRAGWVVYTSLFVVFYFLFAQVYAAPRVRYLAPIFGPAVALATCGVFECAAWLSRHRVIALFTIFTLHGFWFAYYVGGVFADTGAVHYLASAETRDEYLTQQLREYKMIKYVNQNTPPDARIYLLYTGNKFFLFDRTVVSTGHFSGSDLMLWIRTAKDSSALKNQFERQHITYVAANSAVTVQQLEADLTPGQFQVWEDFIQKYVRVQYEDDMFGVFAIAAQPAVLQSPQPTP